MEEQNNEQNNGKWNFLPIGTVVMLKGGEKRLMITGFKAINQDEGEDNEKVWDYTGCLYPEGVLSTDEYALFDHAQIEKIYHVGLANDPEEIAFMKELKSGEENV